MPIYDYECSACHHRFELRQSFQDEPVGQCPRCQGHATRRFHAVAVIYKGSGFYTTDYAHKRAQSSSSTDRDREEPPSKVEATAKAEEKGLDQAPDKGDHGES